MKYRIKEQYGYFVIEKEIESEEKEHTFLSFIFYPLFFEPKRIKVKKWISLVDEKSTMLFPFREPLKFSTLECAMVYIKSLEPKYHEVPKVDKPDNEFRSGVIRNTGIESPYPTDVDAINAAIKSVENDGFKVIAVETKEETLKVTNGIVVGPFCTCYLGDISYSSCNGSCKKEIHRNGSTKI